MKLASGAIGKTIVAKANSVTKLPDILDLKGKRIKYIDVLNDLCLEDSDGVAITTGAINSVYFNLMKAETQDLFIKDVPVSNYQFSIRKGVRDNILSVIDFPNSFLSNDSNVDVTLFVVFWYDDLQISNLYNSDDKTAIDSFEVYQFAATQQRINFDENRTLYDKQIQDFIVVDNSAAFTTPGGRTSVTNTELANSYLTLVKNNFEFLRNIPLMLLINAGVYERIKLQNIEFDFTNSYINVAPSYISGVVGKAYFINVEYKQ